LWHFDTYPAKVRALATGDLTDAAKSVLRPDRVVWVVVGDREKVIEGIRKLGIAGVELIDADGNPAS
jgi:zinc protease